MIGCRGVGLPSEGTGKSAKVSCVAKVSKRDGRKRGDKAGAEEIAAAPVRCNHLMP